ncbi:MAG: inositol monophosphatase [Candidatus Levybacteria bacterium]|nr:inositol monophosphatase [Candidatus Levybacteria bacterium]
MKSDNINNYKRVALGLAHQAGKIMRKNFSLGSKKTWKKDNTPVTETDITVNKLVIKTLSKNFPEYGIIGEEESLKKNSQYQWVCDPLDGTVPFSHGYPMFTFVLALVKNGDPILGVIYDPILDRLFYAEKRKGTFLNGKRIRVSDQKTLGKYSVVEVNARNRYKNLQDIISERAHYTVNFISASYAASLVASGAFVANVYEYENPWDGAAAKIIVEEAGGKVTDITGKEQRYDRDINGFIASNGLVHKELLKLCEIAREN